MSESENLPRRYADTEVARILQRATELQQEVPAPHAAGGLTLRELEEIAGEAGIDPRYLRRAALELDSGGGRRDGWTRATGEPVRIVLERSIPGEIPDAAFEAIVAEIQRTTGAIGQAGMLGRTLTWRFETHNNARALQVVVTSRDGETQVRVEERLNQLAGALFGGLMGGFGGGVGIGVGVPVGIALGSALAAVAVPVGVIGVGYVAARGIFSRISRRRSAALHDLLERVTDVVVRSAATSSPPDRLSRPGTTGERSDRLIE